MVILIMILKDKRDLISDTEFSPRVFTPYQSPVRRQAGRADREGREWRSSQYCCIPGLRPLGSKGFRGHRRMRNRFNSFNVGNYLV